MTRLLSKAHLYMRSLLKIISRMYNVLLVEEVKDGDKRFDFYFTTSPPIVIEIDGDSHFANKVDGFFFKDVEQLIKYKNNDLDRERMHKKGVIRLLRYTDKEFPSLDELISDLEKNNLINILDEGNDEENKYYCDYRRKQEFTKQRKEQNKKFRKELKEKFSSRDRFK